MTVGKRHEFFPAIKKGFFSWIANALLFLQKLMLNFVTYILTSFRINSYLWIRFIIVIIRFIIVRFLIVIIFEFLA